MYGDKTGMGAVIHTALEVVRDEMQINAQNKLIASTVKAQEVALNWKNYAKELEAKIQELTKINEEWTQYGIAVRKRLAWLEDNLKRQSANRKGLSKLKEMFLEELALISNPEACKMLDPAVRKKAFDEEYEKFMAGDQLTF